jgi:hypothetical protein
MTEDELRKEAAGWRDRLPSAEHRAHIRRFQHCTDLTDRQDVALRGYVVWRQLEHDLQSLRAATAVKKPTTKRGRRD